MVENITVHPVVTEQFSVVALDLDLDSCILSGVATLHVSRLAYTLCCLKCFMLYLCQGQFATQKYISHTCTHCLRVLA